MVAAGGMGGRAVLNSVRVQEVVSLSHSWDSAWRSKSSRTDADGCTWDGDDCRSSRCCAKAGSRCFEKNKHWASCNETCNSNVKWEGGKHGPGHWEVKKHHVWKCDDLTIDRVTAAPAAPVTAPPTVVVETKQADPSSQYSITESRTDLHTSEYGPRTTEDKTSAVASQSKEGLVKWAPVV